MTTKKELNKTTLKSELTRMDDMLAQKFHEDSSICLLRNLHNKAYEEGARMQAEMDADSWKNEKIKVRKQAILDCIEAFEEDLPNCSGCTDPRSEGTHQGDSKQHFQESWADHTGIAGLKKREGIGE